MINIWKLHVGLLEETFFIQVKFTNIDGQNKRNRKNVPSSVWTYQSNTCSYTLGSISAVQQQYISLQDNVQMQNMEFTAIAICLIWYECTCYSHIKNASILWPVERNSAHPTKIDFLLEAIIVTKVTFFENVINRAMSQQTLD